MPEAGGLALAFDFGLARIGVAVGSVEAGTANGLAVVANRAGRIDWGAIDRLVRDWAPAALVLGEPAAQAGAGGPLPRALRRFGAQLRARYGLPVARVNEDYTSACARFELRAQRRAGRRGRSAPGATDMMAATYLLRAWYQQPDASAGDD